MTKIYIELKDYIFATELMRRINSAELKDIVLINNGELIEQTADDMNSISEWRFVGLNNTDYIEHIVIEKKTISLDGVNDV
jgi:hypothetical protein